MALERIISKGEIADLKSRIAVQGTAAYKRLSDISPDTLDAAANLAARMVAEYMTQSEIDEQKKALLEGLDANEKKFVEAVINVARDKVQSRIADGNTICTTDGLVLWNSEEKIPAQAMRAIEDTKYDLSRSNMKELQAYFNYGRVFGALDYEGSGKKASSRDIDKMVDKIMEEHQTSGERLGQKIRKITQITGTSVGTVAFGLPLAIIGGAGGFLVGAARSMGHAAVGRDDRDVINAHRRVNSAATSHMEVEDGYAAIKAHKKSYVGKGILWGTGISGLAGTMIASGFSKGLASIGLGGKKAETEAQRIAIRAGVEEGLKARGIGIDEKGKDKDGKEEKVKEDSGAQRLAGEDRTYAPGEYYYDSDEEKKKQILAEIAGALGVEKNKLIESYFRPPQENAFVNIAPVSLKQLNGKKAVIAPDFAETDSQLAEQKALMESYKRSLEAQGRDDIEVVQIMLEGSKIPQWSVAGSGLTAAQVSFAREQDEAGEPQVSVMPKKMEARAAVKAPKVAVEEAPVPPMAVEQSTPALLAQMQQMRNEIEELRTSQGMMAAQLHEMGITPKEGAKGVTSKQVMDNIKVPEGPEVKVPEVSGVTKPR